MKLLLQKNSSQKGKTKCMKNNGYNFNIYYDSYWNKLHCNGDERRHDISLEGGSNVNTVVCVALVIIISLIVSSFRSFIFWE